MIFHDSAIQSLDLTQPANIQALVEVHLSGHPRTSTLAASDRALLVEFLEKAIPAGVTFQQFNELLLVLNQDRISAPFFQFFFGDSDKSQTIEQLRKGVVKFKGYAMAVFGNFRFAFRKLSVMTSSQELRDTLGPCSRPPSQIAEMYSARAGKVLDVALIERNHTWFVGEIAGNLVAEELKNFETYRRAHPEIKDDSEAISFAKTLIEMDEKFNAVQEVALRNTDVYLTWDHLDIYVATSMRNKWEFEEIFDFTQTLFANPLLTPLRLRHFDPTQSKCRTSRDKGLLEGLMLKRAVCTIYMAQESDTLGKDSELANTLAQGKPVIAYVPSIDPAKYATEIQKRPLQYAKLRLLALQAAGVLESVDDLPRLAQTFTEDLAKHRISQPFELWSERDTVLFKDKMGYWPQLCRSLADAERIAFDKRATVLQKYHPLGMQIDLRTGVANGVLVVRSIEMCADLLRAILTNSAEFDINADVGATALVERISNSTFRSVTENEKLTNSFWNLWNS